MCGATAQARTGRFLAAHATLHLQRAGYNWQRIYAGATREHRQQRREEKQHTPVRRGSPNRWLTSSSAAAAASAVVARYVHVGHLRAGMRLPLSLTPAAATHTAAGHREGVRAAVATIHVSVAVSVARTTGIRHC